MTKTNAEERANMSLKLDKLENGKILVTGATIRSYDWELIRKKGLGTYAVIAGVSEDSDDEEIVIEEYSDTDNRKIWDALTDYEAASAVYDFLKFDPKRARETLCLNQTEMAKAMGVSRGLWLKWERQEQRITAAPSRLIKTLVWLNDNKLFKKYLKNFS